MRLILSFVILSCSFFANAGEINSVDVDPRQPTFVVALPSNPTTGYQMTIKAYDKSLLRFVARHFQGPQRTRIGAGGQTLFTFALIKGKTVPNQTVLVFNYARPWEPQTGHLKTVKILFKKKTRDD